MDFFFKYFKFFNNVILYLLKFKYRYLNLTFYNNAKEIKVNYNFSLNKLTTNFYNDLLEKRQHWNFNSETPHISTNNLRFKWEKERLNRLYIKSLTSIENNQYLIGNKNCAMESAIFMIRKYLILACQKNKSIKNKQLLYSHYYYIKYNLSKNVLSSGNHYLFELTALIIYSDLFGFNSDFKYSSFELSHEILAQLSGYGHYEHSPNYSLQITELLIFFLNTPHSRLIPLHVKVEIYNKLWKKIDWNIENYWNIANSDDSSLLFPFLLYKNKKIFKGQLEKFIPQWVKNNYLLKSPEIRLVNKTSECIIIVSNQSRIPSQRSFTHSNTSLELVLKINGKK